MPIRKDPALPIAPATEKQPEKIIETANCSSMPLPFSFKLVRLTDQQRIEENIPEHINLYTLTIGMHAIPFCSASANTPRSLVATNAVVAYKIIEGKTEFGEKFQKVVIEANINGEGRSIEGEIAESDVEKLRSQFLLDSEAVEIAELMDAAYWQRRAEETKGGILRYGENNTYFKAGVAAELGYNPLQGSTMEDRAIVEIDPSLTYGLFGVFDGVGGAPSGEIASTIVAETFHEIMSDTKTKYPSPAWKIRKAFAIADLKITEYAVRAKLTEVPCTTATVCYIEILPDGLRKAYVASIGDSRAYLCREDGSIYPLTVDDSISREFSMTDEISRQRNPKNNQISSTVGGIARIDALVETLEIREIILQPEELLILTTDGVHDVLATNDKDMQRLNSHIHANAHTFFDNLSFSLRENSEKDTQQEKEARQQKIADIVSFFTKSQKENISNPIGGEIYAMLHKASASFVEQEATLHDAISKQLYSTEERDGKIIRMREPQKIADSIIKTVNETNETRRNLKIDIGNRMGRRSKTDNRAVVVVM